MTTEPTRCEIEEPESFYEFVPDGFRAFNPDGNYYREHTSDGDVFQDAETQQTYDTLNDLQLAQGGDQPDLEDSGGNGAQAAAQVDAESGFDRRGRHREHRSRRYDYRSSHSQLFERR